MKTIKLSYLFFAATLLFTACNKDDDDDGMGADSPNISISDLEVTESNDDKTINVNVSLSGTNEETITVDYSSSDDSAIDGSDYEAVQGTLTFNAGENSKRIEIVIKGDEEEESEEKFDLNFSNSVNANLVNTKAVITILDDDSPNGSGLNIPTTGYTTPEEYENYTLVWQDEFQGSTLNQDFWNYELGNGASGWGNNELQYYKTNNTTIAENEYLVIEAKEESVAGYNYTSSRLTTQGKKSFQYGRVDIRAALPKGQGLWPALWMLGENFSSVGWPACGEIDIMEMVGGSGNKDKTVHGTVHWDNAGSYASYGNDYTLTGDEILADEFHVYSIVWDSSKIIWYIDDIQYNVIDITPAGLSEFHEEFFFIFNVAVGGNWPGSPNSTTEFPQRMFVDYIRVFQ